MLQTSKQTNEQTNNALCRRRMLQMKWSKRTLLMLVCGVAMLLSLLVLGGVAPGSQMRNPLAEDSTSDDKSRAVSSLAEGTGRKNRTSSPQGTPSPSTISGISPDPSLYPEGWLESWKRSVVYKYRDKVVGDKGLFPPCKDSKHVKSTYGFVEPKQYLPNSKNPCWYEKKKLKCLPYTYLAGVAKCGTTDINKRLKTHPDVVSDTRKEFHWWERLRFGYYDEHDPEATVNVNDELGMTFDQYVTDIVGGNLPALKNELKTLGSSKKIFTDFSPSYLWDPHNWYAMDGNQGCKEPRIIVAQHIHHVFPAAKIMMIFRHPTPRLYSRFMSRIHRTSFLKNATAKDFHRWVVEGVEIYTACFRWHSVRQCAYNSTVYRSVMVRLVEGMYPVFMADWLRVWPKQQMLLMRYEDYAGHERLHLERIISFLGLAPLTEEATRQSMAPGVVNSGAEEYQQYGDMLPETKAVLDDFYRPFVQMFHDLLDDERFLWKDVYQ